jgi:hypothetical protein
MITEEQLTRKITRVKSQIKELETQHEGKEDKFTYWGGFSMGYLKGKLTILEDWLDDLQDK